MTDIDKILSEECSKVQEVTLSVSGRGIGNEDELKGNENKPEEEEEENANTINLEEVGEVLRNQEEELVYQNNVIMILKMQNDKLKEKLKEIEDHQSKEIKRLGEMETCQEEKEAEWMKRMKEYEEKLVMVDLVLADYDMILEWEEGGVKVYDSICDEEDEMYESDDSLCDDLVKED